MRTSFLLAATAVICLGPARGQAQPVAPDPHAHPNGPHQSLPHMAGDRPAANVNLEPPTVPLAPPDAAVLPAPIVVPTRPVEPPPPPTVSADAPATVTRLPDGLRVTFGTGSADLNPETQAALTALATAVAPPALTIFNIVAYATGTPDDPSTARRLSLSRALALRSVLIEAGVPSPRIYIRALGASVPPPAGIAPDRADVAVTITLPPPPPAGPSAPLQKAAP